MHRLFLIILSLLLTLPAMAQKDCSTIEYLQRLDNVVDSLETYRAQKRDQVTRMKALGENITSKPDRYLHNAELYDACFTFDSELAMQVVKENQEIAHHRQDVSAVNEWRIKESFMLASTGQFLEAMAAIDGMKVAELPHALQLAYYDQMQYLYSHMTQYSWALELKDMYQQLNQAYNDSLYRIVNTSDPDYLWYNAWNALSHGEAQASIGQLKPVVDASPLNCRQDAMLSYALARLYESQGERESYIKYMAFSGMADVRAANMDIASLEELAQVLFEEGDLDHSYKYISVCMETARLYNNQARMVSVARVMDSILTAYQERDHARRQHLIALIWGLALAVLALLVVVWLVWRQHERLKRSRTELQRVNFELNQHRADLASANEQLTSANAKLQEAMAQQEEANIALSESNAVKEEYISYLFSMCSNYISKIDDFRKNINRKAKVKQWDEVLQMTDKSTVMQDELKEFYHNFDAIFLNLYPDFVSQFNALLSPEEQIVPKKGELLNTDLRIYALVRLGINDSTKIAEFLHCSPQTVYNNRLKVRGRALVDKDDFTRVVQQLGRRG